MAPNPKAKALSAVKRAQSKLERTGEQHKQAREDRRKSFEQAREAGLTLREIGEAADLHWSRVREVLASKKK